MVRHDSALPRELVAAFGLTFPYVNRVFRKNDVVINYIIVEMMEEPGNEIELPYIKKKMTWLKKGLRHD